MCASCVLCVQGQPLQLVGWLFWAKRPFETVFQSISDRLPERGRKKRNNRREKKMAKQPSPALTARAVGPCPTLVQISRPPWNWKVTQRNRTTRSPPTTFTDFILPHSSRTEIHEWKLVFLNSLTTRDENGWICRQRRSWWGGSLWATSSRSTLFSL